MARGWCNTHYYRWWRHGDVTVGRRQRGQCALEDCGRPHRAFGLCQSHLQRFHRWGDPYFSVAAEHGTRSRYTAGCRCDPCRQVNREFQREWMRERYRSDKATRERKKAQERERYRRRKAAA